jgi:endonuclease YncB( thermonuclease family)
MKQKNKFRQIFINVGFLIKKFIMKNILAQYNKTNTKFFSLESKNCWARVVSIHDADTITCVFNIHDFENKFYKFNIRLAGIDSPEITSKNKDLQNLAIQAKNRLFQIITTTNYEIYIKKEQKELDRLLDQEVYLIFLKCMKFDKYGRVLADIYNNELDESSINETLLKEKLVYPVLSSKP